MKNLSAIIILILTATAGSAQRYKDVFPRIAQASDEEALALIKGYLVNDLDHPNCNLRLALIYENRYKTSNPITEYERAMANANEAKIRFTKSAAVVNEKEVRKNSGYYGSFSSGLDSKGRPIIEYTTINQKIIQGYDSAKTFTEKLPIIYNYFTKSVDFHDRAIKQFNSINGQFNSRDKLLLMHDTALGLKLKQLISDYDSSLLYLDKYLEAAQAFDPSHFSQQYTIKPIDTYRLQGLLTSPNFLVDNIEIWDYKKWAKEAIREVESDISSLRKELNGTEIKLNNSLKVISPQVNITNYTPYTVDSKLIFDLVKYDNQSLPVSLLRYKQHKQDVLHHLGRVNDRDTTESKDAYMVNLGDLIYQSIEADSLLGIVQNRVSDENVLKYQNYFAMNYKGITGLNDFINIEQKLAKDAKDQAVSEMLRAIATSNDNEEEESFIAYRRIKIPLKEESVNMDSLDTQLHSIKVLENADGSKYVSGVKLQKNGSVIAYLAKSSAIGRAEWYKEFTFTEEEKEVNRIGNMAITPEGCAILVRTSSSAGLTNTLHYVGVDGSTLFSNTIDLSSYPRKIQYIEASNAFLVLYKGDAEEENYSQVEEAQMMSINILGDVLWTQKFNYAGTVKELMPISNGFLVIGNYTEIKDVNGKTFKTKVNIRQTNAFIARFTRLGKLNAVKPVESASSYVVDRVFKVNDRIINLLGYKGTLEAPLQKQVHIIINSGPQVLHAEL